jgi:hypothetical protein
LFPAAAFIAAFFFWVFMNPPSGPKAPMFAGILALVVLRTPMNPLGMLALAVVSIFISVAPVYWLVMPALSTGFDLLSLIFSYSFVFGYLGSRSPAKIQAALKKLDYKLYPDNTPEKVQRLHNRVQHITYRLESLERAHERLARHSLEFPESFVPLRGQVRELLERVFEHWARLEGGDEFEQQRGSLEHLSRDLRQQFDALQTSRGRDRLSDRVLTDLYAMLGTVRGLIAAMTRTQMVINQINWQQWATARF